MEDKPKFLLLLLGILLILGGGAFFLFSTQTGDVPDTGVSDGGLCGNGIKDPGEECDNNESWCNNCVSDPLYCTASNDVFISFEDLVDSYEMITVSDQYLSQYGVSFSLANCGPQTGNPLVFARYNGSPYVYVRGNGLIDSALSVLGNYFISDNYMNSPAQACALQVDFERPTTELSFHLIDVDSGEYYEAEIFDKDNNLIASQRITESNRGAGNHRAYKVDFTPNDGSKISKLLVSFPDFANIGFDGFSPYCVGEAPAPECSDGIDNDGDGKIDCTAGAEDPGCYPDGKGGGGACDPTDDDEQDVAFCGDGNVDTQNGEECDNGADNSDTNAVCNTSCQLNPVCNDGIDNDGDGITDCLGGGDPGCFPDGRGGGGACNPSDTSEEDTPIDCGNGVVDTGEQCDDGNTIDTGDLCGNDCTLNPQCSDGIDNDGDGKIDCTAGAEDPGCYPDGMGGGGACNPVDNNETDNIAAPVTTIPSTAFGDDSSHFLILGFTLLLSGLLVYRIGFTEKVLAWLPNKQKLYEEEVEIEFNRRRY